MSRKSAEEAAGYSGSFGEKQGGEVTYSEIKTAVMRDKVTSSLTRKRPLVQIQYRLSR